MGSVVMEKLNASIIVLLAFAICKASGKTEEKYVTAFLNLLTEADEYSNPELLKDFNKLEYNKEAQDLAELKINAVATGVPIQASMERDIVTTFLVDNSKSFHIPNITKRPKLPDTLRDFLTVFPSNVIGVGFARKVVPAAEPLSNLDKALANTKLAFEVRYKVIVLITESNGLKDITAIATFYHIRINWKIEIKILDAQPGVTYNTRVGLISGNCFGPNAHGFEAETISVRLEQNKNVDDILVDWTDRCRRTLERRFSKVSKLYTPSSVALVDYEVIVDVRRELLDLNQVEVYLAFNAGDKRIQNSSGSGAQRTTNAAPPSNSSVLQAMPSTGESDTMAVQVLKINPKPLEAATIQVSQSKSTPVETLARQGPNISGGPPELNQVKVPAPAKVPVPAKAPEVSNCKEIPQKLDAKIHTVWKLLPRSCVCDYSEKAADFANNVPLVLLDDSLGPDLIVMKFEINRSSNSSKAADDLAAWMIASNATGYTGQEILKITLENQVNKTSFLLVGMSLRDSLATDIWTLLIVLAERESHFPLINPQTKDGHSTTNGPPLPHNPDDTGVEEGNKGKGKENINDTTPNSLESNIVLDTANKNGEHDDTSSNTSKMEPPSGNLNDEQSNETTVQSGSQRKFLPGNPELFEAIRSLVQKSTFGNAGVVVLDEKDPANSKSNIFANMSQVLVPTPKQETNGGGLDLMQLIGSGDSLTQQQVDNQAALKSKVAPYVSLIPTGVTIFLQIDIEEQTSQWVLLLTFCRSRSPFAGNNYQSLVDIISKEVGYKVSLVRDPMMVELAEFYAKHKTLQFIAIDAVQHGTTKGVKTISGYCVKDVNYWRNSFPESLSDSATTIFTNSIIKAQIAVQQAKQKEKPANLVIGFKKSTLFVNNAHTFAFLLYN